MKKETGAKVIEVSPENVNGEVSSSVSYEVDVTPDAAAVAEILEYVGAKKMSAGELQDHISVRLEKLAYRVKTAADKIDVNGECDGMLGRMMVEYVLREIQALELTVSTKRARY
jgi:hypothetical protein